MPRYAAFLRGVSPMNAKMPKLKAAFEAAGFADVKTVLSSGNVVFDARRASNAALQRKAEAGMRELLGKEFLTIVRPVDALRELLASDPFKGFRLPPGSKRIVTFLRDEPRAKLAPPVELDGARILAVEGVEVFSAYVPSPKGGGLHDADREDVRQGSDHADVGHGREGGSVTCHNHGRGQ